MQSANRSPRILVAPLNWGLGHATRCVPIIEALIQTGASPFIASDGESLHLLRSAFPNLPAFQLPSYRIRYRRSGHWTQLFGLLPRIAKAAFHEHRHINKLVPEHQIQGIISDNRLGCWSSEVPSVYLTHQLQLPLPLKWAAVPGNRIHHWFIRKYDHCWVPDFPPPNNLAGFMSTPTKSLHPTYIGPLSRLHPSKKTPSPYPVVALLSGPEPQRSFLEEALIPQLVKMNKPCLVAAGRPLVPDGYQVEQVTVKGYLDKSDLEEMLSQAVILICRSGYSTLMDLYQLGKKAVLIPTPGQPEQEALARRFSQKKWMPFVRQNNLNELPQHLEKLDQWQGISTPYENTSVLQNAVESFLEEVSGRSISY